VNRWSIYLSSDIDVRRRWGDTKRNPDRFMVRRTKTQRTKGISAEVLRIKYCTQKLRPQINTLYLSLHIFQLDLLYK